MRDLTIEIREESLASIPSPDYFVAVFIPLFTIIAPQDSIAAVWKSHIGILISPDNHGTLSCCRILEFLKIRYDQTGEALKLTDIHEDFSENARFGMHWLQHVERPTVHDMLIVPSDLPQCHWYLAKKTSSASASSAAHSDIHKDRFSHFKLKRSCFFNRLIPLSPFQDVDQFE